VATAASCGSVITGIQYSQFSQGLFPRSPDINTSLKVWIARKDKNDFLLTLRCLSLSANFSASLTMFSISSLLSPPEDWITTATTKITWFYSFSPFLCVHNQPKFVNLPKPLTVSFHLQCITF